MIVRKHRLWECFLVEKLDFFLGDEVHDIAEQLEHIKLKNWSINWMIFWKPTEDPHGDPIRMLMDEL
jgi:DtxR family Mn-dependent transcriptional regulator